MSELSPAFSAGTFTPAPGAAPLRRMVAAQAALETRTLLRNGEQLTLTLVIPLLLLAGFSLENLVNLGVGLSRIDFLTPGVIALAVMSTAFTSQAIATGFERRYGVLKRLGATPLSRPGLIAAKTATVIVVELLPTGALSTGLRDVLAYHGGLPVKNTVTLAAWAIVTITLAARSFRWE